MQHSLHIALPAPANAADETRILHILVEEVVPGSSICQDDDVDEEDRDDHVAGLYRAEVPAELEDSIAAACVLGAFHSTFVVNWLEAFTFTVLDATTWQKLKANEDVDWAELGKSCVDIELRSPNRSSTSHLSRKAKHHAYTSLTASAVLAEDKDTR